MNTSVYDNINTPSETKSNSCVYKTINDLLSVNGNVEVKIFCPLCVNIFEFKFSLFEHLRTVHSSFLKQTGDRNLMFEECPFCNAKFYGKHLTAKHALIHHSKAIGDLFVEKKNKSNKCTFCGKKLDRNYKSMVKHLEELHFFDFEEEFRKKFSCDSFFEITISELINSDLQSEKSFMYRNCESINDQKKDNSEIPDCDEGSKINCYDFSDLKQQLENIGQWSDSGVNVESSCSKKPILKDSTNLKPPRKSARRVLRFNVPDGEENKENLVLQENLSIFKKINIDEHSLLCHSNKNEIDKFFNCENVSDNWCGEPKHASTPNSGFPKGSCKILAKDEGKKKVGRQSNFKSYLYQNVADEFEFQCGKCRKLFKENLDLVCHVKKSHKKFSLKAFQPYYRCAVCDAQFYKNYYLRKHHSLHKPY